MCADNKQEIVLRNGETLWGQIARLTRARFLIHTEDLCLKLSEDEIRSVGGEEDLRKILGALPEEVREEDYFHEVHEDGGGTDWVRSCEIHDGSEPKTHQKFVFGTIKGRQLGSEERAELRQVAESMEYRDGWGRALPVTVEEAENRWIYRVAFDMPVFPGEPFELICKKVWPRWSQKEGNEWRRRHYIRPDSGTLISVAIQLPEGARYTHLEPDPLWRMALNGRETAGWRRYVAAEEALMPVVRYRLR